MLDNLKKFNVYLNSIISLRRLIQWQIPSDLRGMAYDLRCPCAPQRFIIHAKGI